MKNQSEVRSRKSEVSKIRSWGCLLIFTFHCLLSPSSFAADVDDIVGRIEKKYNEINDIKGTFSQRSFLKDLHRTEDYSGRFFIKKPSSIRWEYSKPRDEEVIINGNNLWVYKKSERQVLKGTFEKGAYSQLPITLLQGMGDLRMDFYINAIKDDTLELTPRNQMGFIRKIQVVTGTDEFPIKEFTVHDVYDNRVTIKINEVNINTNLDDSIFVFKIPPDVEVFDVN